MSEGIAQRVAAISESATLAVTARAAALRAEGRPVIGFGAGEPDFPTPAHVVEAAQLAAADPRNHRYTPASGLPDLRAAVAEKTARDSGFEVRPENVVITNGGKGAVFATFASLIDPGDEVLLPAPYWVSFPEAAALFGGVVKVIPTSVKEGFRVDVAALEAARTERTKVLVFVSPGNPTGAVYPPDEVAAIGEWAARHGIWILADEIYEHLVYGSSVFSSIAVVAPEAAARCVITNGVAKTYAMTGWRVGWLIGPKEVAAAAGRLQSHSVSNVANVSQRAAIAALTGPMDTVDAMREAFDRRRKTMYRMLSEISGLSTMEPQGAFYAFPSVAGLLGRRIGDRVVTSSLDLASALLEEIEIAVVPGEAFGAPDHVRLSFALGDDDLVEGLNRWREAVS
ncbi:MAG: aspartate aminotransferase [Actinobacteria bacterium RBG_16_68_21]|nr:MAG: aspartate aminotransferase [Actinobacteria bacterium RBG_16_68_21]